MKLEPGFVGHGSGQTPSPSRLIPPHRMPSRIWCRVVQEGAYTGDLAFRPLIRGNLETSNDIIMILTTDGVIDLWKDKDFEARGYCLETHQETASYTLTI